MTKLVGLGLFIYSLEGMGSGLGQVSTIVLAVILILGGKDA